MDVKPILFLFIFILIGFVMLYFSIEIFKKIQLIRNSDEVSIHEAVNRDDIVQINGKARKFEEILESPLENNECFAYEYKVQKRRSRNKGNGSRWRNIDSGKDSVDFIIEDNSGTAYIYTDKAEISLSNETQYIMSNASDIPTTVADNNTLSFDLMGFSFGQRLRLKEGTIQPEGDVFVIGKYNNHNTKNDETIEIDITDTIYISDRDTKQEIRSLFAKSIITSIIGVVFVLFPSYLMMVELGIL